MKRWRSILYTGSLILGGLLFVWQLVLAAQAVAAEAVQVERLWLAALATVVLIAGTAFQITAWTLIMRDLGVPLSWSEGVRGYVLPFLARYIPGLVWGYLNRTHWLETRCGASSCQANAGSVIEVLGLILSAAIVTLVGGLVLPSIEMSLGGALLLALVALGVWLARRPAIWHRPVGPAWLVKGLDGLGTMLLAVTGPRVMRTVPWYLALWLSYGLVVWLSVGMVADLKVGDLPASMTVFAAAWLVGFLVVVLPAGLGLRESVLTTLLVLFVGLTQPTAAVVAVFTRAYILVAELSYVAWGALVARRGA